MLSLTMYVLTNLWPVFSVITCVWVGFMNGVKRTEGNCITSGENSSQKGQMDKDRVRKYKISKSIVVVVVYVRHAFVCAF